MKKVLAAMLATGLFATTVVHAEEPKLQVTFATPTALVVTPREPFVSRPRNKTRLRDAIARNSVRPVQAPGPIPAPPGRQSRGASGLLFGMLAGFYAGGTVGWLLTKNSVGDGRGMGAVIGVPIGGIVGGILGYQLLK